MPYNNTVTSKFAHQRPQALFHVILLEPSRSIAMANTMVIPVAIVAYYVGLACEQMVVQVEATSVDIQIRLFGGQGRFRNSKFKFCIIHL
jgi:hypothetical protein